MQRRVFRLSFIILLTFIAIGLSVMLRAIGTVNLAVFNGPFLNPVGIDYYEQLLRTGTPRNPTVACISCAARSARSRAP